MIFLVTLPHSEHMDEETNNEYAPEEIEDETELPEVNELAEENVRNSQVQGTSDIKEEEEL